MKFSTKGRYGLRAMVDIAVNTRGEFVPLLHIAQRQNISANYLEQLFSSLKKSGLVKSIKGSQGGYSLATQPQYIKVGDILRALEGEINVITSGSEEPDSGENTVQKAIRMNVWEKMNKCLNDLADSLTLEDLAQDCHRLNNQGSYMYYI